ncbi:MAG: ribonuclease HII [Candidatus Colwellbacteria bacterium]|nr:ribonuclease HII [Candidatus Colwellbacteria bacterium]
MPVIGIDEAGRGALAGPVVVAAVRIPPRFYPRAAHLPIRRAADIASTQSLIRLLRLTRSPLSECFIYLDGGLSILDEVLVNKLGHRIKTVIRGDEKLVAIKLGSIVAKVTRDNYMLKLHERYPSYGLNLHKGYGTALHGRRIKRFGPAEIHRLTYLRKSFTIT